ncbi:4F2 cell-surface antigen heavy chain-like [Podarcis lilfordi]|uniref:4F2 cell-surface antigen heavy chain-like n=1 Tax=Podarcis lilfordi TaxID=74358 RepID=A0AA35PCC1_9SAUR|nr:4F2 cell-surface antigen heavy chain-like [Podarcis lilfordi]
MGKAEDVVLTSQVPSESIPLLGHALPSPTYLSQEEVVQQAGSAPWPGVRKALLCLLGALFACLLALAVLLLVTMPRPRPPLVWWQKASFYHLPAASFPDSDGDGQGDLEGVRCQLDQLLAFSIQALVLGPILESDLANLSRILPAHGSQEQLGALVDVGKKEGLRILLELPVWEEELDSPAKHNWTHQLLKGAFQFWQALGVHGFLVGKDPAWRLEAVLDAWSELGAQTKPDRGQEKVLIVLDESERCNISCWVPDSVILSCRLLGAERNLTAQGLAQRVEGALGHPQVAWPGWMVPWGSPLKAGLGQMLGVLQLTLPGVPLLQGGEGSPVPMQNASTEGSSDRALLENLHRSLLTLHASSFALHGVDYIPLPLAGHSEDVFAFLRPGSCSAILVVLNLGPRPLQLILSQLNFLVPAKVLFSTHPEPQRESNVDRVRLTPHQAVLLQVPRGRGP